MFIINWRMENRRLLNEASYHAGDAITERANEIQRRALTRFCLVSRRSFETKTKLSFTQLRFCSLDLTLSLLHKIIRINADKKAINILIN